MARWTRVICPWGAASHLVSRIQVLVSRIRVLVSRIMVLVSRILVLVSRNPASAT